MRLHTRDADGIPAHTLLLAKLLSTAAYTGVILFLPGMLAERYWRLVSDVADDIIGKAADAWADDIELIEEVLAA